MTWRSGGNDPCGFLREEQFRQREKLIQRQFDSRRMPGTFTSEQRAVCAADEVREVTAVRLEEGQFRHSCVGTCKDFGFDSD